MHTCDLTTTLVACTTLAQASQHPSMESAGITSPIPSYGAIGS